MSLSVVDSLGRCSFFLFLSFTWCFSSTHCRPINLPITPPPPRHHRGQFAAPYFRFFCLFGVSFSSFFVFVLPAIAIATVVLISSLFLYYSHGQ